MKVGDKFTYQTADEGLLHCEVTMVSFGVVHFCSEEGSASYFTPEEPEHNAENITMMENA